MGSKDVHDASNAAANDKGSDAKDLELSGVSEGNESESVNTGYAKSQASDPAKKERELHQESNQSKEELIDKIIERKVEISTMIQNLRGIRNICERYQNENQYLQDYVGNLMKSGEL